MKYLNRLFAFHHHHDDDEDSTRLSQRELQLQQQQSQSEQQQQQQPHLSHQRNHHHQQQHQQQQLQNNQRHSFSATALTSALYSIIFIPESAAASEHSIAARKRRIRNRRQVQQQQEQQIASSQQRSHQQEHIPSSKLEDSFELNWRRSQVGEERSEKGEGGGAEAKSDWGLKVEEKSETRRTTTTTTKNSARSGLAGFMLTATIGKTTASTSALIPTSTTDNQQSLLEDNQQFELEKLPLTRQDSQGERRGSDSEWILIDFCADQTEQQQLSRGQERDQVIATEKEYEHEYDQTDEHNVLNLNYHNKQVYYADYQEDEEELDERQEEEEEEEEVLEEEDYENIIVQSIHQMALDANDVELIRASWIPVRKNPNDAGVLLFKGLFTKFPQYLKFFPQFSDLDVERMQENKRLIKHAVKVIETVTFVVDSIGDESKTSLLQSALVNLVRGHLRRNIGLAEFRNLGVVLIDFICDVNNRRHLFLSSSTSSAICSNVNNKNRLSNSTNRHLLNKSTSDSSQSNDSETMTSALDKIRASTSPSSSPESNNTTIDNLVSLDPADDIEQSRRKNHSNNANDDEGGADDEDDPSNKLGLEKKNDSKIDTNVLVAAWTKLYSGILDLVKHEEENQSVELQQKSI